jgi:hypothetical protein
MPKNPSIVLFIYFSYTYLTVSSLGQLAIYLFVGALLRQQAGKPKGIVPPNFIKGLYKISSMVGLSAGF